MNIGFALQLYSVPRTSRTDGTPPPPSGPGHPGFRTLEQPADSMAVIFGSGDHYTLEVDPNDSTRMIVEPGEESRIWYIANSSNGGYGQQAIRDEMADQSIVVNPGWLLSTANVNGYGRRSDKPIAWDADIYDEENLGYQVERARSRVRKSDHLMLKAGTVLPWRGDNYEGTTFYTGPTLPDGYSPLHPFHVGSYGDGPKPQIEQRWALHNGNFGPAAGNWVFSGIETRSQLGFVIDDLHDVLFIDHTFASQDKYGLTINNSPSQSITLYNTTCDDCAVASPLGPNAPAWGEGAGNDDDEFANRVSGMFTSGTKNMLLWNTAWDHNGWQDGYDPDGGPGPQPPTFLNHNFYQSEGSTGTTVLMMLNTRGAGSDHHLRGGGHVQLAVYSESNNGSGFGYGPQVILNVTNKTGNFPASGYVIGQTSGFRSDIEFSSFPSHNSRTVAIRGKQLGDEPGFTPGETIEGFDTNGNSLATAVWDGTFSGPLGSTTLFSHSVRMGAAANRRTGNWEGIIGWACPEPNQPHAIYNSIIVANDADPQNAAEVTLKAGQATLEGTGFEADLMDVVHTRDISIWNWNGVEENIGSDTAARRNEVTIGGYVDTLVGDPIGTRTTDEAIDYLKANYPNRGELAVDIYNYAAERFNRDTIGHTPGATAFFGANNMADGFRADTLLNWNVAGKNDYPVDGDNLVIVNGSYMHSFQTWRFANIDFGTGGGLHLSGGLISATTTQGEGFALLRRAGQFWLKGLHANPLNVTLEGGRFGISGTVTAGLSIAASGTSEFLITSGGSCHISVGQSLSLTGANAKCGFDGIDGASASLTIQGTLAFVAKNGVLPCIKTFRSGHYLYEDFGNGVTGQAQGGNVAGSVVLDEGATITVDTTSLAPGQYVLAENVTDHGAILPAGVSVNGTSLELML